MLLEEYSSRVRESVDSLPLGAKRRSSKDPIHRWFPYYAGYSLNFAETMLRAAELPEGAVVLDPWNGSGTTTLAARRLGYYAHGFDLNPIAVLVAKARLVNAEDARGIRGLAREVTSTVRSGRGSNSDPLAHWLPLSAVSEFRQVQKRVINAVASPDSDDKLDISHDEFPPLAAFLILALIRAAKSLVPKRSTSNPTIFRIEPSITQRSSDLKHRWLNYVIEMGNDLSSIDTAEKKIHIAVRDSRSAYLPDNSVDFALTSPPYCTRLDYADATAFELAAVGPKSSDYYPNLRRNLMGAPIVRASNKPEIPSTWPSEIQDLLENIRKHPTKASNSYYYKTYWQYFHDAMLSMHSIHKILKPKALAALVVQSSYYKDILVDLPSLYVDMARHLGLEATIAHNLPIRTVISTIHPGTKIYRKNMDYRESVVVIRKESSDGKTLKG